MPCTGVVVVPGAAAGADLPIRGRVAAAQRIANRPIICHALDAVRTAGATELAVVLPEEMLPEMAELVADDNGANSDLTYVAVEEKRDVLGTLMAAIPFVGDSACAIHLADGVVGQSLSPFSHVLHNGSSDSVLLVHRGSTASARLGPDIQRLLGIAELDHSRSSLRLAGVSLLGPGALHRAALPSVSNSPEMDLITFAGRIADGGRLRVGHVRSWRRYRGDRLDLLDMNRIVLDQLTLDTDPFLGDDSRIEGRVVVDPSAEVVSSVVIGPVVIGPNARITNSYIGPYTSIGAGVQIEGSEIERSIICEEAKIMHVSGRMEASTVGRGAHVYRDLGLPRGLRLHVGEGVELALN
jgi:glucose-1-phosphate thymidylyltransferase